MSTHFESLVELAESSFRRFAARPLLGERGSGAWSWMTYADVAILVDEVRAGLAALGVRAGDRVGFVSRNSSAWAAAAYATYGLGAAFVPMYEAQRPADWELILRDSGASVVFGRTAKIVTALDGMQPRLPALRHVIAVEGPFERRSLDALRRSGRERPVAADGLGLDVYEGYGLTETSPIVTANCPGARKLGSVGRPIPGVELRIDESLGSTPGEGEILVYGPNVMQGYHGRADESARAFTADGGLRTGDLGRLDADGYLYLTGRIKDQYKLENGKYVMPGPLEEQLERSPYIASAMLYGQDRPHNVALVVLDVERVGAWAVARGASGEDLARHPAVRELIGAELQRLSSEFRGYERPHAFVLTTEQPTTENGLLTPTLKLKRRDVVARHRGALDALYDARPAGSPPRPATGAAFPA